MMPQEVGYASALLESLECLHPGSRELEALRQQLPAPRASDTQRVLEALPFSVFQETLENHLYRQDLASAQATVQSLEPWHLQDYQPEETHWVMDASLKLGMESWVLETTGFWMEKKSCPISILVAGAEAAWNRKDADLFAVITQRILKDQPDHAATYRMIRWHIRNYQFGMRLNSWPRACIMSPRISQHLRLPNAFASWAKQKNA